MPDSIMAAGHSDSSTEYNVLSIPSGYFQYNTGFETLLINDETLIFGMGTNTIVVNEKAFLNLNLKYRLGSRTSWATLTFNLSYYKSDLKSNSFISKRLVQIVVDAKVGDGAVIMTEDLLFNLEYNSKVRGERSSHRRNQILKPNLMITNECIEENILPVMATKVVLYLLQSESYLENCFVDKILERFFSYPKYLCNEDVFSVNIKNTRMFDFSNIAKVDTVYFKVCQLQGHTSESELKHVCKGYFVDSSVTMYQVANLQDFLPSRKVPLSYKPDFQFLLCDDKFMKQMATQNQNLVPTSFNEIFNTLCIWMDPFLCRSNTIQEVHLNPVFLLSGQNGTGKTLLLQALSQYFGVNYWRVDCVTLGDPIPGQAEGKVKAMFTQLKSQVPCILHLANIEALFLDADFKDDIRVINCFEQQMKKLKLKWPAVVVATTQTNKCITSNMNQLFLDKTNLNAPDHEQREDIMSWLVCCNGDSVDKSILQSVASQTSGFVFRDLQILIALAFKEKYKRSKEDNKENNTFILADFSKIIGTMHKAYSDSIGAPRVPSVSWRDVGGLEPLKKEILRSLRSNMFNTGLRRSGLLLHGPPGTGKTLLAKAVATQCGRNFLSVKGPELLNMYVGQSEQNVRDLFELAKVASPCIIFFDELDSLAPNRGRSGDSGGVMDRVVSQLLAEMDDLANSGDVFILGATNRPDLIDPALLRPGRLDKLLYVGPCADRSSQLSVLSALTNKLCLEPDVDLEEIVSRLPASVTGAQLSALCSAAWLSSARHSIRSGDHKLKTSVALNQDHFLSALGTVFNQQ